MSVQAISYVIEHSTHKGSYLLTLLMIANHAHSDGTGAWPSIALLAEETRLSERGVQYCIERLKDSGELLVLPDAGPRGTNAYAITMTQSLRQSKSVMTQDFGPMTQDLTSRHAIAIAPEPKNRQLEREAPPAVDIFERLRQADMRSKQQREIEKAWGEALYENALRKAGCYETTTS